MINDIVTRLRIACRQEGAEYCGKCQPCEAADEIELLRAGIKGLDQLVKSFSADRDRLKQLLKHGLTDAYDCEGCELCAELKSIHSEALSNV